MLASRSPDRELEERCLPTVIAHHDVTDLGEVEELRPVHG
jgi:hypothetical protein